MSGLPAWLGALGTLAACGLAWIAYTNWRRQELAKRKADAAEKILQSAHILANAMTRLPCMMLRGGAPINEASLECVANEERIGLVDATIQPAAQLRTYLPLTRVYFGEEAHSLVKRLISHSINLSEAMNNIAAAAQGYAPPVYGDEDTVLDDLMTVCVFTRRDSKEFQTAHQKVRDMMADIEKILQPFMCYDETQVSA